MDIPYLREQFIKHKNFLIFLYEHNSRKNSKFLTKANDKELNILIKILFLICNGKISLKLEHFKVIEQSKRLNLLRKNFDHKNTFLKLLRSTKLEKIAVLKKFTALYSILLKTMFSLN